MCITSKAVKDGRDRWREDRNHCLLPDSDNFTIKLHSRFAKPKDCRIYTLCILLHTEKSISFSLSVILPPTFTITTRLLYLDSLSLFCALSWMRNEARILHFRLCGICVTHEQVMYIYSVPIYWLAITITRVWIFYTSYNFSYFFGPLFLSSVWIYIVCAYFTIVFSWTLLLFLLCPSKPPTTSPRQDPYTIIHPATCEREIPACHRWFLCYFYAFYILILLLFLPHVYHIFQLLLLLLSLFCTTYIPFEFIMQNWWPQSFLSLS